MNKNLTFLIICLLCLNVSNSTGQDVYSVSSGEMIFSWADVQLKPSYMQNFPNAEIVKTPTRFTVFLHLGQYVHFDLNNNIGFFTGGALRNVGFITDERVPRVVSPAGPQDYQDYKIIRRSYLLGVPLALKVGTFKDHLYIFGGGEIEWAFLWKEKWWDQHSRNGTKSKNTAWWPNNMETFLPSVFAGVQFPKGFNIKFKYYLNNFVNLNYNAGGDPTRVSNLTRYETVQTMYISMSWQFSNAAMKKLKSSEDLVSANY